MVERQAEAIKLPLLCRQRASWRFRGVLLENAEHSFVSTVLLR
jgi:hypothetical protein